MTLSPLRSWGRWAAVAVQDVNPKFVDEFYVRLQKTRPVAKKNKKPKSEYLTPGTIHSIHKILRCAFEQAVKWEIIARNPFPHANKPKTNYKKRDIWTADMIRKALDAVSYTHLTLPTILG